jgi:transcriptional regulator with XRE-family HTH domain
VVNSLGCTRPMTFGERMRALVAERGISLRQLAKTVHYDVGGLSKVSRDLKRPSPRMVRALDDALEAGGELVALASSRRSLWRPPSAAETMNGAFTPDDEQRLVTATRAPRKYDPGLVDALATVLDGQRRTEDLVGSGPLIEPVAAQLSVVETLVREARGDLRLRIVDIAAQWAQFFAWLHASIGDLAKADRMYDRAIVWAAEVGNADMVATAFNMKGHTAWQAGQLGPMLGLSRAAQRDGTTPGVRALAMQQEARAHAILGDTDMTDQKLDEAHTLTVTAAENPVAEPPWIYFFNPDMFALQRARAYLYLPGRQAAAAELLTTGIAAMPPEVRGSEWLAFYLVDLVRAYRELHEHAEAEKIAEELAALAARIESKRLAEQAAALV